MNPHKGAVVQDVTYQQDPCLTQQPSILRFGVLALLFLTAVPGSVILLILLEDRPYGIQLSSIVGYTAAVALYTFSRNRNDMQPFLLSCPVVRRQLPLLIRRHLGFIVADCSVKVRIAWPHLPKNPRDYDKQMEAVLSDFLTSVAPSRPVDPTSKGVLRRNEEPH